MSSPIESNFRTAALGKFTLFPASPHISNSFFKGNCPRQNGRDARLGHRGYTFFVTIQKHREKPIRFKIAALFITVAAAAFFGLPGCDTLVNDQVGSGIKTNLVKVIGPADSWDVKVTGNPGTILKGRIPGVDIHGANVQAAPSLTLQSLDIDANNIHFNTRSHDVSSIDSLRFGGVMNQSQLDSYLKASASSLPGHPKDLKIELRQNDLKVSFKYNVAKIGVPVTVDGALAISAKGDDKIDFIPSKASVAKAPIPKKLLDLAVKKINPVVDLATMPFPLHLSEIKIDNSQIFIAGFAFLPPSAIDAARKQFANAK